mmetsp:Transcript_159129/g.296535  ORF Transcript_159129/g.296535 Transcript_159129/m.296535 type:complete len:82 (+) Transcript_159129:2160-2405(+)
MLRTGCTSVSHLQGLTWRTSSLRLQICPHPSGLGHLGVAGASRGAAEPCGNGAVLLRAEPCGVACAVSATALQWRAADTSR